MKRGILFVILLLATIGLFSMDFQWWHYYQKESSSELTTLMNRMCGAISTRSVPTEGFTIERPGFKLTTNKGVLYFENDPEKTFSGFYYEGNATINFAVNDPIEQKRLERCIGKRSLENFSLNCFYVLPIGEARDLPKITDGTPSSLTTNFVRFKTALRKDGIKTLFSILNRPHRDPLDIIILFELNGDVWSYAFDSTSETEVELRRLAHPPNQDDYMWDSVVAIHRTKGGLLTAEITPEEFSQKYFIDVKSYDIDYKLDDGGVVLDGSVTVKLNVKTKQNGLLFSFYPEYNIFGVKVNNEDAYFIKEDYSKKWGYIENDLLVVPKSPVEGEVSVTFKTKGPLFLSGNGFLYLKNEDLWYPHLEDWDGATYKIKMTVPKENEIIAVGELKNHTINQDSTETFLWETEIPIKLATFVIGKFIHKIMELDGLKLDVALPKGVRTNLLTQAQDYTLNELKNDVIFYTKAFGPLPYPTLKVVITNYAHGRGFPTLLLLSASAFFRLGSTWPDQFMAHEVAHQWWGNQVDGLSYRDVWLSEGMAEFSSMLYMGIRFGEDKVKLYHENMLIRGSSVKTSSLDSTIDAEDEFKAVNIFYPIKTNQSTGSVDAPFEEGPICLGWRLYSTFTTKPFLGYNYIIYTKGNFVFQMLFTLSKFTKGGQDAFFKALQTICSKYRWQKITTKMFFGELQNSLGVPLAQFLKDWYEGTGMPKVEVKTSTSVIDGVSVLKAEGKCDRNFFFGVPIRVKLEDKRILDYILLFQNGIAKGEWKLPAKSKKVVLDPMRVVFCEYGKVKG